MRVYFALSRIELTTALLFYVDLIQTLQVVRDLESQFLIAFVGASSIIEDRLEFRNAVVLAYLLSSRCKSVGLHKVKTAV